MSSIASLAAGEIHLWLTFYDEIQDQSLDAYRELLDPSERAQELRFHFADDRRRYLTTRALVRTALSRYAPIDPKDWRFSTNPYGCPEIADVAAGARALSFNVSHTSGLIVLGVTADRALGVDVENTRARAVPLDVAERFFAPAEATELAALTPDGRHVRFFEYWTLKESYVKARGLGLSLPLHTFSFSYPNDRSVSLSIDTASIDEAARWKFWQFRPTPEHLAAVCAERAGAKSLSIVVRRVTPMLSESAVVTTWLRTSQ